MIDCTTAAASKVTTGITKEGNVEVQGQFSIETAACKTRKLDPQVTVFFASPEGTFVHNEKGELETVKTKVKVKNKAGEEIEVEGFEPKYETKTSSPRRSASGTRRTARSRRRQEEDQDKATTLARVSTRSTPARR